MRAVTYSAFGGPEVLQWTEVETPQPGKSEVLIKVAAAGLNRADLMQRRGDYPVPEGASPILGLEVAGEIAALGEGVRRWKKGDKVCAIMTGGGYAEYAVVPEGQCLPIPEGLALVAAAGLPEAVLAVWHALFEIAGLEANDSVLMHSGSGGIGTMAIQMARLMNVRIFVTVGSDEKAAACRDLGAALAINNKTQDFVKEIRAFTSHRGIEAVIDTYGGDCINRNLKVLAPFGVHVSLALQLGRTATVNFASIIKKSLTLTAIKLRTLPATEKARLVAEIEKKIWPSVASGKLKPLIYKTYPLKDAIDAHKMMETGAQIGKIILEATA